MNTEVVNVQSHAISEERLAALQIKIVEMATSGIIITDCKAEDDPIVYTNERFTEITGYTQEEVLGKNCRFLQGAATDHESVKEMGEAIKLFMKYEGEVLNYKKDGTTFWNHVIIIPIFENGLLTNYMAVIKDNTQVRHKNLQIRKVQDNLQYLISKSNIVIYTCDYSSLELTHLSENIVEELGYAQNELLKTTLIDLVRKDYKDKLGLLYYELINKKEFVCEHQLRNKYGDYVWVEHRVKLIMDDQNEPLEIIGYLENVTSKHREEALDKANKSLESLVNSRTVELLIRSQELSDYGNNLKRLHKISTQSFNSNADLIQNFLKVGCEIFKLETGVVTRKGDQYFEIKAHHSSMHSIRPQSRFLAEGSRCNQSIEMQETIMSHNAQIDLSIINSEQTDLVIQTHLTTPIRVNKESYGTLSFFSQKAKKHSFNRYQIEMIEMMAQSIGTALAKERSEEKRRHVESLYMALAKNIPHSAVFIFDKNLKYLVAEGEIPKEYDAEDICGKTMWDVLPNDECIKFEPYYRTALLGTESAFESTLDGKNYLSHSIPIINNKGEVDAGMILMIEITERKQRAQKIEKLNYDLNRQVTLLEFANKELESFNYSVSHDLRAPLRSINSFSKILTEEHSPRLDDESMRLINIIDSESQKMSELIDDLLSFSKLRRTEQIYSNFALTTLVNEVIAELSVRYKTKPVHFVIDRLPEIYADRNMIKQLLVNLLSNAIKFSGKRSNPEIKVVNIEDPDYHTIVVEDNGVGFNEKYKHKLFGVFQRLHSHDEFEGTGVGLALVQRIVQRHHGKVWAESCLNQGAKFYFTIPKTQKNLP